MTPAPPPPPWTVGSVVAASYGLARDNFGAFFGAILIFGIPPLIADLLELEFLGLIIQLFCSVATAICITCATLQAMAGYRPDTQSILRQLQRPDFGRLLMLGLIQHGVILISAILIIPPLFLGPLWAVTIPVLLIERTDIAAAFWRSTDLTRFRRLRILGVYLAWLVIFMTLGGIIFLTLGDSPIRHIAAWLFSAAASTVVQPLAAIFYVLLRSEKEGMTVQQITAALD